MLNAMTEAEWLTSTDVKLMLSWLRDKTSDRKLRLFMAACARTLREAFGAEQERVAEIHERLADGKGSKDEEIRFFTPDFLLQALCPNGLIPPGSTVPLPPVWDSANSAAITATEFTHLDPRDNTEAEKASICNLLRDVTGNPFRSVSVNSSWQSLTVLAIAQAIYEERRFSDLPILADALEEAGCSNAEILAHCRGLGPHVRGCWVIDTILGKV